MQTAKALLAENPKSILEIGSGSGVLYRCLLQQGFLGEYLGMDITQGFIDHCTDMYGEGIFVRGDMRKTQPPKEFDVCILQDVLRHNPIEDRWKILKNIVPKIKKKLVLAEPLGAEDTETRQSGKISNTNVMKSGQAGAEQKITEIHYWDGTMKLESLLDCVGNIKPIQGHMVLPRGTFDGDEKFGMLPSFIVILFKEE